MSKLDTLKKELAAHEMIWEDRRNLPRMNWTWYWRYRMDLKNEIYRLERK